MPDQIKRSLLPEEMSPEHPQTFLYSPHALKVKFSVLPIIISSVIEIDSCRMRDLVNMAETSQSFIFVVRNVDPVDFNKYKFYLIYMKNQEDKGVFPKNMKLRKYRILTY